MRRDLCQRLAVLVATIKRLVDARQQAPKPLLGGSTGRLQLLMSAFELVSQAEGDQDQAFRIFSLRRRETIQPFVHARGVALEVGLAGAGMHAIGAPGYPNTDG